MDDVARLSAQDRADLFSAAAGQRGFAAAIIEKDFWVCWTLKRLFTLANPPAGLIFKGGTSLSKVFQAIERFSEDVDLSFNREDLGFGHEKDPLNAPSRKKQQARVEALVGACQAMIRDDFLPRLKEAFTTALGSPARESWQIELDPDDEEQQTVLFRYPASGRPGKDESRYLRPLVRLEMGARGEHWPSSEAVIRSYAAETFPELFKDPACTVKVVAAERTFWEKATILHMWFHAGADKKLSDRQSRHYYDVVRLYQSGIGQRALQDLELLTAVSRHKMVFFPRAWAKFHEAIPGTLRLVPPDSRIPELERDYQQMCEEMIFGDAPALGDVLDLLREIERQVNERLPGP
jgi:Nucleotidyl transferase AbiEii toxin, Type IV TA system